MCARNCLRVAWKPQSSGHNFMGRDPHHDNSADLSVPGALFASITCGFNLIIKPLTSRPRSHDNLNEYLPLETSLEHSM